MVGSRDGSDVCKGNNPLVLFRRLLRRRLVGMSVSKSISREMHFVTRQVFSFSDLLGEAGGFFVGIMGLFGGLAWNMNGYGVELQMHELLYKNSDPK